VTVCKQEQREVQVSVCKMVEQVVNSQVYHAAPGSGGCDSGSSCGGSACGSSSCGCN